MAALQVTWFFLVGLLFTGYAVLAGYDLGVGFWNLWVKKDDERRILQNSIAAFWDGNEVWLLTGGAALFAAFPRVYATVFSGFYLALMLVLFGLILRAVSLEFRGKLDAQRWRGFWDWAFSLGSIIPTILFGVALGNILGGLPLDQKGDYGGGFLGLLNVYALLIGLLGLAMVATHGALFLVLKTTGGLSARAKCWAQRAWIAYLGLLLVVHALTVITQPELLSNYQGRPMLWAIPLVGLVFTFLIGVFNQRGQSRAAFISSVLSIISLPALCATALFPNLVPASNDPNLSLTIMNASSSQLTLNTMLILTLAGLPLVIAYTWWIHRIFGGKVRLDRDSY